MLPAPTRELGPLLRQWRDRRGKSQLALSLDTGISQRHISFVEGGRSAPSSRTLLQIADALDVPLRERNALLLAAGYAPAYADPPLDAPGMESVASALRRMLRLHEPHPALVMDRYWDVLMTNDATAAFFGGFLDMTARPGPRNLLHLMFDPQGMRPHVANWDQVAAALLGRVAREAVGRVMDERTRALIASLLAYPGVEPAWQAPDASAGMPMIPIGFTKNGRVLNYFSMVTTLGTPQTVTAQELRIESMCPADDVTARLSNGDDDLRRN